MLYAPKAPTVDLLWRVWVLPQGERWALASGAALKQTRGARKVTLDAERYARLLAGRLGLDEPLDAEPATLDPAA